MSVLDLSHNTYFGLGFSTALKREKKWILTWEAKVPRKKGIQSDKNCYLLPVLMRCGQMLPVDSRMPWDQIPKRNTTAWNDQWGHWSCLWLTAICKLLEQIFPFQKSARYCLCNNRGKGIVGVRVNNLEQEMLPELPPDQTFHNTQLHHRNASFEKQQFLSWQQPNC